jgi:hypothetical protein
MLCHAQRRQLQAARHTPTCIVKPVCAVTKNQELRGHGPGGWKGG